MTAEATPLYTYRRTPGWIQIVDSRLDVSFNEDEGGRWITWCDLHKAFCQHERKADAKEWARQPGMWCEGCREATKVFV